jgi:hypothetical protein
LSNLEGDEDSTACTRERRITQVQLNGEWAHKDGIYRLELKGKRLVYTEQTAGESLRAELSLDPVAEWFSGAVYNLNGKKIGFLRLKPVKEGEQMVSNFKKPGGEWGRDLTASKDPFASFARMEAAVMASVGPQFERTVVKQKQHHKYSVQPENRFGFSMITYRSDMWHQVVRTPLVWLTLIVYLSTVTLMRYGPDGFHAMFDDGYFKPSATMLSACGVGVFFFLTNFFNKALQRYYTLYDYSVNMEGRIYDILMYLQEHCEDGNAKHRHYLFQCWRWCVAAQVFTYAPLEEGLTAPLCDYLQLLTPEERIFFFGDLHGSELVVSSNHAMRSCMKWCMASVRVAMKAKDIEGLSPVDSKFFDALLVDFRVTAQKFWATHDLPVPIDYIQVMLVSMLIYCSLIAYTVGLELSELGMLTMYIVGPVIMFCFATQLVGLFYLSRVLEFPYGDDMSDLPYLSYILTSAFGSYALFFQDFQPEFLYKPSKEGLSPVEPLGRSLRRSSTGEIRREQFYG